MISGSFLDSAPCLLLFEQQSGKKPSDTKRSERCAFFFIFLTSLVQPHFPLSVLSISQAGLKFQLEWGLVERNPATKPGSVSFRSQQRSKNATRDRSWGERVLHLQILGLGWFWAEVSLWLEHVPGLSVPGSPADGAANAWRSPVHCEGQRRRVAAGRASSAVRAASFPGQGTGLYTTQRPHTLASQALF